MILDFPVAEMAQVDFGQGPEITDGRSGEIIKTWIFVMTLAWSRHQYAEIIRNQNVETWLACHRHAFEWFNGVVRKVTIVSSHPPIPASSAGLPIRRLLTLRGCGLQYHLYGW